MLDGMNAGLKAAAAINGTVVGASTAQSFECAVALKATQDQLGRLYNRRDDLNGQLDYICAEIAAFEAAHVAMSKVIEDPKEVRASPPRLV